MGKVLDLIFKGYHVDDEGNETIAPGTTRVETTAGSKKKDTDSKKK